MATRGSDKAFVLADGYNLSGDITDLDLSKEAVTEETTGLGDSWQEHSSVNLKRGTLSWNGFYDDATGIDTVLNEQQGTQPVVCVGWSGQTNGEEFTGLEGMQATYQRVAGRGTLHKISARIEGSGQIDEGVILHALGAETAAGNGTAHDNTASSAAGAVGYLEVTAVTLGGYTSWTVKLQHSTDNVTYADLITFTNVTGITAQRSTAAGTVNRYTRTNQALNGAGASPSITFFAGISRG